MIAKSTLKGSCCFAISRIHRICKLKKHLHGNPSTLDEPTVTIYTTP